MQRRKEEQNAQLMVYYARPISEKPSFADPTGGATNATQKTRFLMPSRPPLEVVGVAQ